MEEENVYGLYEMMDDFAMLTYLKPNYPLSHHERNIREEALERVNAYGGKMVREECLRRQHADLVNRLQEFENLHPEVKNDGSN